MSCQEYHFVRYGVMFIFFGLMAIGLPGIQEEKDKSAKEYPAMRTARLNARWEDGYADSSIRKFLIDQEDDAHTTNLLRAQPVEVVRSLASHLELRPAEYKHDAKCIHLLGVVKNYLDALDKPESDGMLEVTGDK